MGGSYEEIGSSDASVNVNPLTGGVANTLNTQLTAGTQGAEQLIQQLLSGSGGFDFLNILGDERLSGAIGQFAGERNTLAEQAAGNAQRQISGQFGGSGLYSGAFGEAVGKGVGEAYQGAATDIAGQQLNLFNNALGIAGNLQGQNTGQALSYYGQQAGGALAGLTGLGAPSFYTPTYGYEKGIWDYGMDAASLAVTGLTGAAAFGLFDTPEQPKNLKLRR